jgi:tRNA A37 threonylcarbamoyladenosine dehydratase
MSVGSHAATSWMLISRASAVKISDPDTISLSNLNRLELGVKSIRELKVDVMEQRIKEINPYCKVYSNIKTDEKTLNKMILGCF